MQRSRSAFTLLSVAAVILAAPAAASAQWPVWSDRVIVSVNVAGQRISRAIPEDFRFDDPYRHFTPFGTLLQATVTSQFDVPHLTSFDAGGAVRVAGGLGIGLAVSSGSGTADRAVQASIPHPVQWFPYRDVEGTVPAHYSETAIHLQAVFVVPMSSSVLLAASAGPTYFDVKHDLTSTVTIDEASPFNTATFRDAPQQRVEAATWGFNLGVDLAWMFTRHLGVGGLIRFSYGNVRFSPAGREPFDADVGGAHAGAGARLAF